MESQGPLKIYMPLKAQEVLSQYKRYSVLYGGRGSGKSFAVANHLIAESVQTKQRILCTRELQNSIRDSVHRLLVDRILAMGLDGFFYITQDSILCRASGSYYIFKGLKNNISEIKSLQGVTRCWVEEAEKVSKDSLDILTPTIREEGSQLFFTFNPESEHGACYQRFVVKGHPDSAVAFMNYDDNDLFPKILNTEMEYDKKVDFEKYEHVWMGKPKKYAHALIFKGKFRIEEFITPDDAQLYYGADWGFSNDPTCLIRMWIKERKLYIDYEAYNYGVEIEDLPALFKTVPGSTKWKIMADSARPDTVSYVRKQGFHCIGAEKGKGSVEDGIEFIRSFEEIIIHPRCPKTYNDFNNYKWKTDKVTNEVLPIPADGSDHAPDAIRYALEHYMKQKVTIWQVLK